MSPDHILVLTKLSILSVLASHLKVRAVTRGNSHLMHAGVSNEERATPAIQPKARRWPRHVAIGLGGYAAVAGAAGMVGWISGIYPLTDWFQTGISIKTNAAIAACAAGVATLLMTAGRRFFWMATPLALLVALLGAATALQHATGVNLGIDTLLFDEVWGAKATASPNRMGMPASTCFFCFGLATMLLRSGRHGRQIAAVLAFVICSIASLSVLGYLYGAEAMYGIPGVTGIAFQTTSILLALGLAIFLQIPERLPMKMVLDQGTAGILTRRALGLVIVVPVFLGWLRTIGGRLGLFDAATGRSLLVLCLIGMLVWLLFWAAAIIRRRERDANRADRAHVERIEFLVEGETSARARLETVIDSLAQPLVIVNSRREIVRSNPAFRLLHRLDTEYPPREPELGRTFEVGAGSFVATDVSGSPIPHSLWPVGRALAGEQVVGMEMRVTNAKNGWSYVGVFNAMPLYNCEGAISGAVCTIEEITDRKRVEMALRQNEALFSALVDQAPMGVYVIDGRFRLQRVNSIAEPVFGSVRPLIGRDFDEVMRILWGPAVGAECARIFRHTLATGERYISPSFRERRNDLNEEQAYEWETQRITLPDGQYGVVCYFHDVTERERAADALRESEARTRLATEATGVGIWDWNVASGELRWNAEMFRIYGLSPTENGVVSYETWERAVHPDDLPRQHESLEATIRTRGTGNREFRIRRPDGVERFIQSVDSVRTDGRGRVEWVVGTNLDVTEHRLAKRLLEERVVERTHELEEAQTALRRSERFAAMGTLAAGLGHDLGNLLLPLRMRLDTLERHRLVAEAAEDVAGIRDGLKYLQRLSAALRQMAADPGVAPPAEGTSVAGWWEDARGMIQSAVPRGVLLQASVTEQLPSVRISAAALTQAIFNLVQNAGEALTHGAQQRERVIRMHVGPSSKSPDWVEFAVADNGPGMSHETATRCFEPYFSTKGRAISTGMGLSLVRGVVEAAGGVVECHSSPNQGATFAMHLPPARREQMTTPLRAVLDIQDGRLASIALVLLRSLGVEVQPNGGSPQGDESLWVSDRPDTQRLVAKAGDRSASGHPERTIVLFRDPGEALHGDADGVFYAGQSPPAAMIRATFKKAILQAGNGVDPLT